MGSITRADGTKATIVLIKAHDLPIRRHVLIKGDANPFDPQWRGYYRERLHRRLGNALHDRQRLAPPPPFIGGSTVPGDRGGRRGLSRMSGN